MVICLVCIQEIASMLSIKSTALDSVHNSGLYVKLASVQLHCAQAFVILGKRSKPGTLSLWPRVYLPDVLCMQPHAQPVLRYQLS